MIFPKDKGFKHEAYGAGDVQALLKDQEVRDQKKQTKLPDVTTEDNGKVLSVVEGNWDKALPTNELPDVTVEDNGKVLSVVDGVWDKAEAGAGNVVVFTIKASGGIYELENATRQDIENVLSDGKIPVLKYGNTTANNSLYAYYTDTIYQSGTRTRRFTVLLDVRGMGDNFAQMYTFFYDVASLSQTSIRSTKTRIALYSDIPTT